MEKYYLILALIIYIIIIAIYGTRLQLEIYKRKEAEKKATGNMTDAEKLHYIAYIYSTIDLKKVNYQLRIDWYNYLKTIIEDEPEQTIVLN